MVNENNYDLWSLTDRFTNTLQIRKTGECFYGYTDCERWEEVELSLKEARELRDWLTAKLEGKDGE